MLEQITNDPELMRELIEAAAGLVVLLPLGTWLEKKLDGEMEEKTK